MANVTLNNKYKNLSDKKMYNLKRGIIEVYFFKAQSSQCLIKNKMFLSNFIPIQNNW